MEKIWLKHYPPGVPEEANLDEWPSLKHVFDGACKQYRDLPAFTNMGKTITYSELDQQSRYFGAFLQNNAGLEKGDRVALMMPNLLQYPVALFGVLRTGMVAVNVNPLYTPRELQHQLTDSGAKAIVILENFASTLEKVIDKTDVKTVIVTSIGDMLGFPKRSIVNFAIRHVKRMVPEWNVPHAIPFLRALNDGKWQTLEDVDVGPEDLAFLQYTGGTTGVSKGAMLSHRNMTANLAQMKAWLGQLDLQEPGTVITALPLYHIFALTVNLLSFLIRGGRNVLITNPRDFDAFVAEMKKYPFTFITGVNTLYNALLNTPGFSDIDFGPLKGSFAGGMAAQEAVAKQWKEVTGNVLTQGYGLTETSPVATSCLLGAGEYDGSIGVPMPSTDLCIRDDDGNELGIGEIGEICIKGPQVMEGYWNRPEETAKVITEDGWLRTGDMGRINENGLTFIEDRKKDMILVSGFNVYPNEIEEVAVAHDGVLEAAAVGLADEKSGEVVKLFVVRKDPSLDAAALKAYCKENLTGYKVPRVIEFRDELPKSNVGKILRRELRDEANS